MFGFSLVVIRPIYQIKVKPNRPLCVSTIETAWQTVSGKIFGEIAKILFCFFRGTSMSSNSQKIASYWETSQPKSPDELPLLKSWINRPWTVADLRPCCSCSRDVNMNNMAEHQLLFRGGIIQESRVPCNRLIRTTGPVRTIAITVSVSTWSMYVCMCPLSYLNNRMFKLHEIFCTCYVSPWLGAALTTMQ